MSEGDFGTYGQMAGSAGLAASSMMASSAAAATAAGTATASTAAMGAAAGPVGWAALAVMAAATIYSSRKRKKKAKEIADQRQRQIKEIRRRAQANAALIREKGTKISAASEMMAARGKVTGESVLNQEIAIIDKADRNAEKTIQEAEFAIQGIQMEIQNRKDLADEQYKADMINLVTDSATMGTKIYGNSLQLNKPTKTNPYQGRTAEAWDYTIPQRKTRAGDNLSTMYA
jgi:membrane protein implicated in regulation of membrane protease activity